MIMYVYPIDIFMNFLDRVGTTCWMAAFLRNPNAMSMMFSEVPLGLFFQLGMDCAWHIFDQFWLMMPAKFLEFGPCQVLILLPFRLTPSID